MITFAHRTINGIGIDAIYHGGEYIELYWDDVTSWNHNVSRGNPFDVINVWDYETGKPYKGFLGDSKTVRHAVSVSLTHWIKDNGVKNIRAFLRNSKY